MRIVVVDEKRVVPEREVVKVVAGSLVDYLKEEMTELREEGGREYGVYEC
jgi:hypothetical protein